MPMENSGFARPRVLVLEPAPRDQELVSEALDRHCDLIFQADPLHVFELIDFFEPDLLITALEMPHLTGFELISLISHRQLPRPLPILVFSHDTETETQKLAYRLGALHFQAKPCRPIQLFKGAAAFFRLAGGQVPAKRHTMEEVRALLAECLQREELHPLLQDALAAHMQAPVAPTARRVVGQVAMGRAVL